MSIVVQSLSWPMWERPSITGAASPDEGKRLYEHFVEQVRQTGTPVATGIFQADMQVHLVNDGPVIFILESQ